jgi:hypothetical protein
MSMTSRDPVRSSSPRPDEGLSVLTLNVQHANAARSRRQASWLARHPKAEVVVLTEVGEAPAVPLLSRLSQNSDTRFAARRDCGETSEP